MNAYEQTRLDVSTSIEPQVLVKTKVLFEQPPKEHKPDSVPQDLEDKKVPWWRNEMSASDIEAVSLKLEKYGETLDEDKEIGIIAFRLPSFKSSFEEESEVFFHDDPRLPTTSTLPPENDISQSTNNLKVIAKHTYPYHSHSPSPPTNLDNTLDPFPYLSSFIASIFTYISAFFIGAEPAIIEYSPAHIKLQQSQIRVEAQVVEFDGSEQAGKVVGVVASLHVGNRTVPIVARPKRVRELLRADGVEDLPEEIYEREIKGALKMVSG
jgi:hypothetical protein